MHQAPLADRMRPSNFNEFVGQEHLVAFGKPLRVAVKNNQLYSIIFWGPPGSGKTTLARILANETEADFIELSAVSGKVADIRAAVKQAIAVKKAFNRQTILFVDEIHRFSKSQQDVLLPHVERGEVIFIGATTENPSFEVIGPLLSRCHVYVLHRLSAENLREIAKRAVETQNLVSLQSSTPKVNEKALDFLIRFSNGDARAVLNGLEVAIQTLDSGELTVEHLAESLQRKAIRYDKAGEEHYNTISAFIKSMRASDSDAALYYLARILEAGEEPKFIARRMLIFASEDVGNADFRALLVAEAVTRAVEFIGLPEAAINLAQGVTYLATAKKSRASYNALRAAQKDVSKTGNLSIPMHLRNPVTDLMEDLGYGKEEEGKTGNFPKELGEKEYYSG